MQKKEVCNRAGGYSAKQQRDDITQERDDAVLALIAALNDPENMHVARAAQLAQSPGLLAWITDHKADTPSQGGLQTLLALSSEDRVDEN